jgi:L-amino acid N-acyltransferase YncA
MLIRDLAAGDLEAVTRIYAHAVEHGTATFEETAPSADDMRRRHEKVASLGLPWLVAEAGGQIAGYAYADRFRERSAYRFTLEDSVYVDPSSQRLGAGRALLGALIPRCEGLGYRQIIAAIGDSANLGSIGLHRALGFREVGVYASVGMKFGRWLDVVLMQRALGDSDRTLPV